jgi:hypothetical protein
MRDPQPVLRGGRMCSGGIAKVGNQRLRRERCPIQYRRGQRRLLGVAQRRTSKLQPAFLQNVLLVVASSTGVTPHLYEFLEESFDLPGRIECHQDFSWRLAYTPKCVGYSARAKNAAALLSAKFLISHLKEKLALQYIPPFILAMMQVKNRARARRNH